MLQAISNSINGLQRMTSGPIEVQSLLWSLIPKIHESKHELNAQQIGNALYGLQQMRSEPGAVKAF